MLVSCFCTFRCPSSSVYTTARLPNPLLLRLMRLGHWIQRASGDTIVLLHPYSSLRLLSHYATSSTWPPTPSDQPVAIIPRTAKRTAKGPRRSTHNFFTYPRCRSMTLYLQCHLQHPRKHQRSIHHNPSPPETMLHLRRLSPAFSRSLSRQKMQEFPGQRHSGWFPFRSSPVPQN